MFSLSQLCDMVANTEERTLNKKILGKIIAISPNMFAHKWELRRGKYELIVDIANDDKNEDRLFKEGTLNE
jgi:hypothetical protein